MNKKTSVIAASVIAGALALSGCSNESYEYELSGTVEAGQVDYDCPNDLAMAPVALSKPNPGPRSGAKQEKRKTGGAHTSKTPGKETKSSSPKNVPDDGVKLSKKPEKPERIRKVPAVKHASKPKGCEVEYELFVQNSEGLFEQDVRQVDFDKCMDEKREPFPACTKN